MLRVAQHFAVLNLNGQIFTKQRFSKHRGVNIVVGRNNMDHHVVDRAILDLRLLLSLAIMRGTYSNIVIEVAIHQTLLIKLK